jgi:hypothetical protein
MSITDPRRVRTSPENDSVAASGPGAPIGSFTNPEMDLILAERRFDLETLQPDAESSQRLRKLTIEWTDLIRERPVFSRAWPPNLYIPGQADWRKYWFSQPPHANVYQYDWTGSTGPAPFTFADNGTGNLAAVISPAKLSGQHHAWAGMALRYDPTARLSQVHFTADLQYLAVKTYTFLTSAGFAQIHFSASAFLAGWEINPVTSKWERLNPFLRHTVLSETNYGQQGGGPSYFPGTYEDGALGVNFLVEGGKRYAFGVSFESFIALDVRENDERTPYARRPTDQIELEVRFGGSVMRMTVDTTVVYQA